MSHFVSNKDADFDSLNHQLLQRSSNDAQGDDEGPVSRSSSGAASAGPASPSLTDGTEDTPTSSSFAGTRLVGSDAGSPNATAGGEATSGMSAALASRRRVDLSTPSTPTPGGAASRVSSYSRKNSPSPSEEYPNAAALVASTPTSQAAAAPASRPLSSVSSGAENSPAPHSHAHTPGSQKRKLHRNRDRKLSDPEMPLAAAAESSAGSAESGEDSFDTAQRGGSGGLRSRVRSARETGAAGAGAGARKSGKGVSFSDKRSGPGESPHKSPRQRQGGFRGNTGLEELGRQTLGHAVQPPQSHGQGRMINPQEMPPRKLGTWDGVFMPVSLNILGIILFLRFGFILGQAGLLGALLLLLIAYSVDALTAMSVSAISTNGQVRGGGAYYLISRSLGPEFGGSIGLVFFLGQALNAAMNVLGFVESLTDAFGESRGASGFLPEGPWWNFGYGSLVLVLSTLVCLVGSALFARATLFLAVVLGVAIISIPVSSFTVAPFINEERGAYYTGWALATLRENLMPRFTSGAAGSSTGALPETWQSVFGVLFPAVTGMLAGASMSGDLRKPSKSIPKGTNWSLVFTFVIYVFCFVIFAGTIRRESFYLDVGIVSDVAASPQIITFGALASTGFSTLMGVMACGKVLQAIARDNLLPVLDTFAQGTEISDTPIYAVIATYIFCQSVLLVDSVNTIAQLVTMTCLLTFGTLCFATLALKAGGAPSFRPSFRYWNIWTAGGGTVASFGAMFFTDPLAAIACIVFAIFLFTAIHIFCPPKPWGDVTRNLNYHIVRKYLLRLDERKAHVKYWRPQILLLVNNARTDWNLIIFCNSLKKGALYVLGHVLKGEFNECLIELRKQQIAWLKLVDITGIKSFVDVIIARDEREGARNLILSCGLGGMRPNIVVVGFPADMRHAARQRKLSTTPSHLSDGSEITIKGDRSPHTTIDVRTLPTDSARRETPILPTTYVGIMEDTLALNKALAIAHGFESLSLTGPSARSGTASSKEQQYIDLWPVQIQSPDSDPSHAWDTYTMVLQLGTILSMTGTWKSHQLRVSVFVELQEDVEDERKRVRSLLDNLRVPATLRVFHLASGDVTSYQSIVWGKQPVSPTIEMALGGDPWWEALKHLRREDEKRAKAAAKRRSTPSAQPVPGAAAENRKQTKREQKIMGVSLPAEHLAFFKRNMRIGLAHPRAKLRPEGQSDAEESEWSEDDSDEDSDLSDELARLGFDDDDWLGGAGSPGLGLRRSQTQTYSSSSSGQGGKHSRRPRRSSIGGSAGLPDEPSRPLLASAGSPGGESSSYGSLSSTPRARTMNGNMPFPSGSGTFTQRATIDEAPESDMDGTLKASDRARAQARLSAGGAADVVSPSSSVASSHQSSEVEDDTSDSARTPRRVRSEEGVAATPRRRKATSKRNVSQPMPGTAASEAPLVSFNALPNKAQYLILNEVIRNNSGSDTTVVLTSLPAPEPGTCNDEAKSLRYLEQLENLFAGGPPVLGVHAKQLTMTSAL